MNRVPGVIASILVALGTNATPRVAAGQGALDELKRVVATLPAGFLDISQLDVTTEGDGSVTATGVVTLLGSRTDVLLAMSMASGQRAYRLGLRPDDWQLSKAVPGLALPALDGMTLSNVGLVISGDSVVKSSEEMSGGEYDFYADLFKADEFTLKLRPGINLFASIPVEKLPEGHPLLGIMDALGIEKGVVRIQGTLGKSLAMLGDPTAATGDALRDLFLRAELPPMRPKGSPEWFGSGQLALEITGEPALRLAGEMNVRIQEDELAFFLAAALAKDGMSLAGGLKTDRGWEQPFGIEWLTLYKVVLKIGITSIGSVQLGFGADLVIGQKDMQVAVAIAISPAGVPTNFIFDGESETGFGLSDLATLQAKMATAGQEGGGAAIPLDALPPVEFRNIGLKFAPKDEPDLGVAKGMAVKGRMLLASGDGSLKDIASVDVNVGADGMWVKGTLSAFQVGPLTWQDAMIDLTATRDVQRLRIAGDVQLLGNRQKIDLDVSKTQLRFNSVTRLYGLFAAQVDATAAFDLKQPKFRVHAVAESELAGLLQPMLRQGVTVFTNASGEVIRVADGAIAGLTVALSKADATVDDLRNALERQRANAREVLDRAQAQSTVLARETNQARARRDAAFDLWENTPVRQLSLRGERRNAWLAAVAAYNVAAGRSAAQVAVVAAARRVLDALPPVDQNVAVMAAAAAARSVRTQLETAQRNLEALKEQHEALVAALAQGGTLFALTRGEVTADLEAMKKGQAVEWRLAGVFVNTPFDLTAALDLSEPAAAAGAILSQLIHR
ncbi:MAG TPA: hypothetical protein VNM36_04585 [Gemmatimonadaceae bacterium]|nr:hypothetical protein [Gemmatimonadaceae bacterium]